MGVYGVFIALAIAIIISILIIGIMCIIYLLGQYDSDEYIKPTKKGKKK